MAYVKQLVQSGDVITDEWGNHIQTQYDEAHEELVSHMNDYVKQMAYATASGTDTYTVTINGITSLVEGLSVKVKFTNANTGASTLNINGLGAVAIKKSSGNDLSSGNIKVGQVCHLVYTGSVFQLLGEGGEYGTAQAEHVLEGYTIGTENGIVQGTMPNNGNQSSVLNISGGDKPSITIPAGYTLESTITAQLDSSLANFILENTVIGGVTGTLKQGVLCARGSAYSNAEGRLEVRGLDFSPKFVFAIRKYSVTQDSSTGTGYSMATKITSPYFYSTVGMWAYHEYAWHYVEGVGIPTDNQFFSDGFDIRVTKASSLYYWLAIE